MPEIVGGAGYATFINTFRCEPSDQDEVARINVEIVEQAIARRLGGLIRFEPHQCEVVHVAEAAQPRPGCR